jgi:hypothetical protein
MLSSADTLNRRHIIQEEPVSDRPLRTALFVDFDNIYSGLDDLDGVGTANYFATHPMRWLSWIEAGMPGGVGSAALACHERTVLIRRCYLNPRRYSRLRGDFTRAAFTVIDCPPITQQGKTSTDIHMVMDVLDTLDHRTNFDEFIILSGDSDFTPVLLRLRAHDRRTVVVSVGPAAEAYKAAADRVIDGGEFIEHALEYRGKDGVPRADVAAPSARPPENAIHESPSLTVGPSADEDERIMRWLVKTVRTSREPLSFPHVANLLRTTFDGDMAASQYAGHGTFSSLLKDLALDRQGVMSNTSIAPGYLYDPALHVLPVRGNAPVTVLDADSVLQAPEMPDDLASLAGRINSLTGTPFLTTEQYAVAFRAIADELKRNDFSLAGTSKAVRDQASRWGSPVSRAAISFVLQGCSFAGHRFNRGDSADLIGKVFRENVRTLCRDNQLELSVGEEELVDRWILGIVEMPGPLAATV